MIPTKKKRNKNNNDVVVRDASNDNNKKRKPKTVAEALFVAPRITGTLARRLVKNATASSPEILTGILRQADDSLAAYRNIFEQAPADAFVKRGSTANVTKAGDSVYVASFWERAANHFDFLRSTGFSPQIYSDAAIVKRLDNVSISQYPDFVIFRKGENVNSLDNAISELGENGSALRNTTNVNQVDNVVANNSFFKRFRSSEMVQALSAKKVFYTVTGAAITVAAGMLIADLIKEGIAKSTGCFIYERADSKTVNCYRVLGYTCGESGKLGDELWIKSNLPTKKHFFSEIFDSQTCPENKKCKYCDMEDLSKYPGVDVEEIPANQSIFCHTASMMEILDDMLEQTGRAIGSFFGSVAKGLFGEFSWVALVVSLLGGVAAGVAAKFITQKNPNKFVSIGVPILSALVVAVLLYVIVSAIKNRNSGGRVNRSASANYTLQQQQQSLAPPYFSYDQPTKSERRYYKVIDGQDCLAMYSSASDVGLREAKITYTDVYDATDYAMFTGPVIPPLLPVVVA